MLEYNGVTRNLELSFSKTRFSHPFNMDMSAPQKILGTRIAHDTSVSTMKGFKADMITVKINMRPLNYINNYLKMQVSREHTCKF